GPLLMGIGGITMGLAGLAGVAPVVVGALGLLLSPLGLVAAAAAAAGATFWYFRNDMMGPFTAAVTGAELGGRGIVGAITGMGDAVTALLAGDFTAAWDLALSAVGGFLTSLTAISGLVVNTVGEAVTGIAALFSGDFAAAWDSAGQIAANFVALLGQILGVDAIAHMKALVEGAREWLVDGLGAIFDWAGEKVDWLGDKFFQLYDRVVGNSYVPDMAQGVMDWFGRMFDRITPQTERGTAAIAGGFADMGAAVTASARTSAENAISIFDDMGQTISRGIAEFVRAGDFSLGALMRSVANVYSSISSGALDSALSPITSVLGNAVSGLLSSLFANGAAFRSGAVVPFASGGVVSRATAFPMTGGSMGVMGEAGPEAILPLSRGPGGRLGVQASTPHVSFDVRVESRDPDTRVSFTPSRRQQARGARRFAGA
ncbi:MAG: phage tail tape measure protein, partial [Paracoccaceae bacterium]